MVVLSLQLEEGAGEELGRHCTAFSWHNRCIVIVIIIMFIIICRLTGQESVAI